MEEITEYLIEMKIKYMSGLAFPPKDDVSIIYCVILMRRLKKLFLQRELPFISIQRD